MYEINLRLIIAGNEKKNSEDKDFIENLKKFSKSSSQKFLIVFNKRDITLKIDIDEVKMKMPKQEFYSKVDVKINYTIESEDIIKMLKHIPSHLELRLEADYIEQIIKLAKSKTLIEVLKEQGTKFLLKGIEIEARIIESKQDEDHLKNEVKEIEAKRCRLNMDCDK